MSNFYSYYLVLTI